MSTPIQSWLAPAHDALEAGEKCVLCSVVRLEGSGYGRVGARLLVTESGERTGYISGGCLEKDLCRRALHEALTRPKLMTFDTRGQALTPSRYNTGCEGLVYVFCQPLSLNSFVYRIASLVNERRQPARLLTVYRSEWPSIRVGECAAEFGDESRSSLPELDTSSGSQVLSELLQGLPGSFTATLSDDANRALDVVVERLEPMRRLLIFGAGDDVQPVARLALAMGWQVGVVGKHAELANARRFPGAQVYVGSLADLAPALVADEFTHVISMSHDFLSDLQLLPLLVRAPVRSIGLLGSKRRLAKLLAELYYRGERLSPEQIDRIRSPLGLDIGGHSPEDIALSILSELLAIENGKAGTKLSDKNGSVHTHLPHRLLAASTLQSAALTSQVMFQVDSRLSQQPL